MATNGATRSLRVCLVAADPAIVLDDASCHMVLGSSARFVVEVTCIGGSGLARASSPGCLRLTSPSQVPFSCSAPELVEWTFEATSAGKGLLRFDFEGADQVQVIQFKVVVQ